MKARGKGLFAFVPSGPSFSIAVAFFSALGFDKVWEDEGLSGLRFGDAYFVLQDIDVPAWQENQMMTLEVDDLDVYWGELVSLDLPGRYRGVSMQPPADLPWGREATIVDPGGVCWHVRQGPTVDRVSSAGEEEKVMDGNPAANMPALLTKDVPGG